MELMRTSTSEESKVSGTLFYGFLALSSTWNLSLMSECLAVTVPRSDQRHSLRKVFSWFADFPHSGFLIMGKDFAFLAFPDSSYSVATSLIYFGPSQKWLVNQSLGFCRKVVFYSFPVMYRIFPFFPSPFLFIFA